MKITALVENRSNGELTPVHGLSLYMETEKHKLLFDLGPDDTLLKNAAYRFLSARVPRMHYLSCGESIEI